MLTNKPMNTASIVGIVIGVLAAVAFIVFGLWWYYRREKNSDTDRVAFNIHDMDDSQFWHEDSARPVDDYSTKLY